VAVSDDDSAAIWRDRVGVAAERIVRMGDADNFWPAGAPTDGPLGPGGHCSEIFWDYRTNDDPQDSPANQTDTGRFVEIWNLVFPQFNVAEPMVDGRYTLEALGRTNVDTGAGLERLACVLQGKRNNFDTDLFQTIIRAVSTVSGQEYREGADGAQEERNVLLRRIADHVRAVCFCIADGALPGNTGRGYIVRRLIRRATLDLDKLGRKEPGLHEVVPAVVEAMGDAYPEVVRRAELATETLASEERQFRRTLGRGIELLQRALARHREAGKQVFAGDEVFDLFTTYGFPPEMTEDLVEAEGMRIDHEGFERRMAEFAEISKGGREVEVFQDSELMAARPRLGATGFIGYDELAADVELTLLEVEGRAVEAAPAGTRVRFALDRTPFYAESGGQVADVGTVNGSGPEGTFSIQVDDVQKDDGFFVHAGEVVAGIAAPGPVHAVVDAERRAHTVRHHSATHLMHSALGRVLGDHIEQQGSKVEPELLRFDFNHPAQPSRAELAAVEDWVNREIAADHPVRIAEMPIEIARETGAKALFGEKYGDVVRVVDMGGSEISVELCGGCHVARTGEIGPFRILREEAVAAGIRRVTAVAGEVARAIDERERAVALACARAVELDEAVGAEDAAELARVLKTAPEGLPARVESLVADYRELLAETGADQEAWSGDLVARVRQMQEEVKRLRKVADKQRAARALEQLDEVLATKREVAGVPFLSATLAVDGKSLRQAAETLRDRAGSCVALLGSDAGGKAVLVAMVSADLVERGIKAGELIARVAPVIGGRGGGKPDQAQGGGPDHARLGEALDQAEAVLAELVGGAT